MFSPENIEMYHVDRSDLYFTQGDYIDIDLNEEFRVLDNQFNSVSFEIDGVHNRLQFIIYGSENKVWIPTSSKSYEWSLDETPYRVLRHLTIIQLIDSVDIENTFLSLGILDENEWYNFHIESNFINDYSIIEYYVEEGLEMYIIDEYGEKIPMNETNFHEDRIYIAMEFNLFGSTDASNSSFTVTDSITYYFDITDFLIQ